MTNVRAVIGIPLYNGGRQVEEAIESLLSQTFRDFAVVVTDDRSTDGSGAIVRRYRNAGFPISYDLNPRRVGMVGNYHRVFALARELHPEAEYFAFASDHDAWHPRWLSTLVRALDEDPAVVLAYPLNVGIDERGVTVLDPWTFETAGVKRLKYRVPMTVEGMAAGSMVYGLCRVEAVARAGVFRYVLLPDRILLGELALQGEFRQVPEILWYRRYRANIRPSLARQRRAFFPDRAPLYSYFPWWVQHAITITWVFAVRGEGPPDWSRIRKFAFAIWYSFLGTRYQWRRHRRVQAKRRQRARASLARWRQRAAANLSANVRSVRDARMPRVRNERT